MSKTMTVYIPTTGDSSSRTQSKVVTINNLKSVDSITVNTGTVTFSKNGNDITITCNNGVSVRQTNSMSSQYVTSYQNSSSNSFSATMPYNSGGYSGTLSKNGLSYVISGSYTPSDSHGQSDSRSCTVFQNWSYDGDSWVMSGNRYSNAPSSINYSSGGYVGVLPLTSLSGTPPTKTGSGQFGQTATTQTAGSASYYGTVTSPASDTRVWRQDYAGTVYGPTTYTDYYAYVVTLTYTDTVRIGTVNYKTSTGIVSLPVYDLTMTDSSVRIKLPSAIGCFELVSIGDVKASNIRIQTQKGLKAIAKS